MDKAKELWQIILRNYEALLNTVLQQDMLGKTNVGHLLELTMQGSGDAKKLARKTNPGRELFVTTSTLVTSK